MEASFSTREKCANFKLRKSVRFLNFVKTSRLRKIVTQGYSHSKTSLSLIYELRRPFWPIRQKAAKNGLVNSASLPRQEPITDFSNISTYH